MYWRYHETSVTRLGFAVLLKFFQVESRFPRLSQEVPGAAVKYLAEQFGVPAAESITENQAWRSGMGAGGQGRGQGRISVRYGGRPTRRSRSWKPGSERMKSNSGAVFSSMAVA